jgi:hypothetical protein
MAAGRVMASLLVYGLTQQCTSSRLRRVVAVMSVFLVEWTNSLFNDELSPSHVPEESCRLHHYEVGACSFGWLYGCGFMLSWMVCCTNLYADKRAA